MLTSESIFETKNAQSIYDAVLPELETPVSDRSAIELSVDGSNLLLKVTANDVISMRSALNTWYRLIQIASEVSELAETFEQE